MHVRQYFMGLFIVFPVFLAFIHYTKCLFKHSDEVIEFHVLIVVLKVAGCSDIKNNDWGE